jgi:hypothetical protein
MTNTTEKPDTVSVKEETLSDGQLQVSSNSPTGSPMSDDGDGGAGSFRLTTSSAQPERVHFFCLRQQFIFPVGKQGGAPSLDLRMTLASKATSNPTALTSLWGIASNNVTWTPWVQKGTNFLATFTEQKGRVIALHAQKKPTSASPSTPAPSAGSGTTQPVGRQVGLVDVNSASIGFTPDGKLKLLVDGSINVSSVSLGLIGLGLAIDPADLLNLNLGGMEFSLEGLSLSYHGTISASGVLLRLAINDSDGNPTGRYEYIGQVNILAATWGITGIGSYATLENGEPSAFIYAALIKRLGGPPVATVLGVAMGFGYNRGINVPDIKDVNKFPLVTALYGPDPSKKNSVSRISTTPNSASVAAVKGQFAKLSKYLPMESGQYMLAMGLKISTFEIIDSIAVLMVELGERFTAHIVGRSLMKLPPKVPMKIGAIEMAFKITLDPGQGLFSVDAILTSNSYLFSKDCKLTGGFALRVWFGDSPYSGDWMVTLGGYHPKFNKPSHYPDVPRLGLYWEVIPNTLQFKGGIYAALCPSAIMAGGGYEATFNSGPVSAWYKVQADFIIMFDPFYLEAKFSISVGMEVDILISLSAEISADVEIWGPEFAGRAKVDLKIYSASFGFGPGRSLDKTISWQAFRDKYVLGSQASTTANSVARQITRKSTSTSANENTLFNVIITEGQLGQHEISSDNIFFTVEPDAFEINISTQLPLNNIMLTNSPLTVLSGVDGSSSYDQIDAATPENIEGERFAIAPMGGTSEAEVTDWDMIVTVTGPAGMKFTALHQTSEMPLALWGDNLEPDISSQQGNKSLLTGIIINAATTKPPGFTEPVDADEFKFQDVIENDPYWQWGAAVSDTVVADSSTHETILTSTLNDSAVEARRQSVVDFFGFEDEQISLTNLLEQPNSAFIGMPQAIEEAA